MPAAPTPAANEPRVIKKYANRRLYDTQLSAYVTLADVRQLVMQRILHLAGLPLDREPEYYTSAT